jgi:acyl transferase domain-containing protein
MLWRLIRPDLQYVATMRKGEDAAETVRAAIADLWLKGAAIQWAAPPASEAEPGARSWRTPHSCSPTKA